MEHPGHVQAGGQESSQPWIPAKCVLHEDEVVLYVNEVEVARLVRSNVEFEETTPGVFEVLGADEPLFFHPADPERFQLDWIGPVSTAERIALAASQPRDNPQTTQPEAIPVVIQRQPKSRTLAAVLALFLGGLGIHKFYLGQIGWGVVYLVFVWTFVPMLAGAIEGIRYLLMSDKEFFEKYG